MSHQHVREIVAEELDKALRRHLTFHHDDSGPSTIQESVSLSPQSYLQEVLERAIRVKALRGCL